MTSAAKIAPSVHLCICSAESEYTSSIFEATYKDVQAMIQISSVGTDRFEQYESNRETATNNVSVTSSNLTHVSFCGKRERRSPRGSENERTIHSTESRRCTGLMRRSDGSNANSISFTLRCSNISTTYSEQNTSSSTSPESMSRLSPGGVERSFESFMVSERGSSAFERTGVYVSMDPRAIVVPMTSLFPKRFEYDDDGQHMRSL
jgi:hypothetical protein